MFPSSQPPLPFFDRTQAGNAPPRVRQHKVDIALARLRALHEELNSELYAHPNERPQINSPANAAELLMCFIGSLDHEEMWILDLDTRNRVRSLVKLYQGSVSSSQVRIAEVFRQAVAENASALIVAHNHPSGDRTPSPDDVSVTRSIVQAGQLLEIQVLDHLVLGGDRFVSLKERGLGFA